MMERPRWKHYHGGCRVDLGHGIMATCTWDEKAKLYRINFAGVNSIQTYTEIDLAQQGVISFANRIVAELIWGLLEIENHPGDDYDFIPR